MTRIRYKKTSDGKLVSPHIDTQSGQSYLAIINLGNLSYVITNRDASVYKEGKANSLHSAKVQVKERLVELGAKFDDEIRKKVKIEVTLKSPMTEDDVNRFMDENKDLMDDLAK